MDSQELTMICVEDDDNVIDRLRRRFVKLRKKKPKFRFMNVRSFEEYLELQKDHTFDVVTIDMKLWKDPDGRDADEEGGLKVARKYRVWNPGAVAVMYTAYPDLRQCVEVMRCGAWDYIDKGKLEKEKRNSIIQLIESIEEGLERRFTESGPTSSWLEQKLPELVEEYRGQYVAFVDQIPVDSDHSLGELRKRMRKEHVDAEPFYLLVPKEY